MTRIASDSYSAKLICALEDAVPSGHSKRGWEIWLSDEERTVLLGHLRNAAPNGIESAPRDGTPILGWVPSYYQGKGAWVVVHWALRHERWMDNRAWFTEPTFWMPLPDAISPATGERK
jgi:hypothetical protein